MKSSWIVPSVIALVLGVGCGGDDGASPADARDADAAYPADDRTIPSLTRDEMWALCKVMVDSMGGEDHETQCKDFIAVSGTYQDCLDAFRPPSPLCVGTVAQFEACAAVIGADPCTLQGDNSEACQAFRDCL